MNLLVLPKLAIHNANALSSPFTIGFPAMTAWLGFSHALQRKLNQQGYDSVEFLSTAVVSHEFDLQTYKGNGDFVHSIIGTANPLDKDGTRSAFIEEARCHLTVSLVIEYQSDTELSGEESGFIDCVSKTLHTMKVASGDLKHFAKPKLTFLDDENDAMQAKLLRQLMPGYALIDRHQLMQSSMQNGQDAMDAMLDQLKVTHSCEETEDGNSGHWQSQRENAGWLVPIAVGFQGISKPEMALNQRDPDSPHCFAESIVTLGEFKLVNKVKSFDDILWAYNSNLEKQTYLCQQVNQIENY